MNIFGITEHKHNTENVYKDFNDVVSEEGRYNYRLFSLRLWDLHECIDNLKLRRNDIVLEFGAWNTYAAIFTARNVEMLYVTDSFCWAKRAYSNDFDKMSAQGTCSPERWIEEFSDYKNIIAEKADIEHLHYKNNMFDKVYSISVIEHVPNDVQAINEVYRVLKPGGIFTFTCEFHPINSREFSSDTGYYRVYTPSDMIDLIKQSKFKFPSGLHNKLKTSTQYTIDNEFTALSITLTK